MACSGDRNLNLPSFEGANVLLISVDTCRIDYLEPYGGTKAKTPAFSSLAKDGHLFLDTVSPAPLTLPAHASLLTGLHPIHHGARDNFNGILNQSLTTIAELFQESGYTTASVIGAILLSRRSGFEQGFQDFFDEFTPEEFKAVQPTVERKAGRVTDLTIDWLEKYKANGATSPFFLFAHYYDPHMLYSPRRRLTKFMRTIPTPVRSPTSTGIWNGSSNI